MTLAEHFRELRNRLQVSALAVAAASVVGWMYYEPLFDYIMAPLEAVAAERGDALVDINFGSSLTEPFSVQLRISLFVGILLASPVWIWQVWAFLLPGLTPREKRVAAGYFVASLPLFFAGCAAAVWAVPRAVGVLLSFTPEGAANL